MCFAIIYNQSIHGLIFKFNRKQLPRFQIAGQYLVSIEEDTKWMDQNIDQVCGFLTDNQINRWEHIAQNISLRQIKSCTNLCARTGSLPWTIQRWIMSVLGSSTWFIIIGGLTFWKDNLQSDYVYGWEN